MSGNKSAIIAGWFGNGKGAIIEPTHITDGWDYLFFTDKTDFGSNIWRPIHQAILFNCPKKTSKWFKIMFPHFYPDYERSIFIDSEKYLIDCDLDVVYEKIAGDNEFTAMRHRNNNCTYKEIRKNKVLNKEEIDRLDDIYKTNLKTNLKKRSGLYDTSVLLRLHTNKLKSMMLNWSLDLMTCKRDQCSVMHNLFESKVNYGFAKLNNYKRYNKLRRLSNLDAENIK